MNYFPGFTQVTVVDCDVHQGDGTAALFADDPSVRTISFHCQDNFPTQKMVTIPAKIVLDAHCRHKQLVHVPRRDGALLTLKLRLVPCTL